MAAHGIATLGAANYNHFEVLRWARQQQPPCPLSSNQECQALFLYRFSPCMLVYLLQQRAHLTARHLAEARDAASEMVYAVLLLRAALPDGTPDDVVLNIVSLAFS